MALILTRAKRTLGAFLFSILLYIFPSLTGGCNVQNEGDGGAEAADVASALDGGAEDFGNTCGAYGPPPCDTDADCAVYGEGFYCDKTNTFGGCGGEQVAWPACKQAADAGPADIGYEDYGNQCAAYGPKPCDTDEECVTGNGAGWYCDKNHQAGYCNGQPMTWPTCVQGADAGAQDAGPADFGNQCGAYGPPPCQDDAECVTVNGAGWYCDKSHQVDMCGTPTTFPTCLPGGDK